MGILVPLLALVALYVVCWLLAILAQLRHKAREFDRVKPKVDALDDLAAQLSNRADTLAASERAIEVQKQNWQTAFEQETDRERRKFEKHKQDCRTAFEQEAQRETRKFEKDKHDWRTAFEQETQRDRGKFEKDKQDWRTAFDTMAAEKCQGFPWLADAYADYLHLQDLKAADYLTNKQHPASKAALEVRSIAAERRKVEKVMRVYRYLVEYYETLFPWLEDFKGEDVEQLIAQVENPQTQHAEPTDEEQRDPASKFLTKEEYARLSPLDKFQLALDRYWMKKKSSWELGRDYERYVGYMFESNGFKVYYQGIVEGLNDLGRDLVCDNGNQICVVQCKNWSEHKTIREKHICQLFGTVTAFRIEHPSGDVRGTFVTSTSLSPRARQFAEQLGISVAENLPFQMYPCVKCNVSRNSGERIYHLPFDQQYDNTIIEPDRGECYVATVAEAEAKGFRRAFRWRRPGDEGQA